MHAALALSLLVLGQPAPAGPASPAGDDRVMLMPVRTPAGASPDVVAAAAALEGELAQALGRHAGWKVVTRADVQALVDVATRDQLVGCDAESCLAELADALGTSRVVMTTLDVTGGTWNLQASLLDTRSARALRRSAVRARGAEQLLDSADAVGRSLAADADVAADDPRLAARLGTDEPGVAALREELPGAGGDLVQAWTRAVIGRNTESGLMSVAQGALVVAAAGGLVVGALITGLATGYFYTLSLVLHAEHLQGAPARFPWLAAAVALLAPVGAIPVVSAAGAALLVLALRDRTDEGRVRASRKGCCRDEPAILAASGRRPATMVAVALAVVGTLLAASAPCAFFCTQCACGIPQGYGLLVFTRDPVLDPVVELDEGPMAAAQGGLYGGLVVVSLLSSAAVVIPGAATALLLLHHGSEDLLDDTPPAAALPATPAPSGSAPPDPVAVPAAATTQPDAPAPVTPVPPSP